MNRRLKAQIKTILKEQNIIPAPGIAYIIYECHHVCDSRTDPKLVTYYTEQKHAVRSCSICKNQKLLTKYKICVCGQEHFGPKVQYSKHCQYCPPHLRTTTNQNNPHYQNGHLFDDTKGFCKHRLNCCTEYALYETLPCKNCQKYEPEQCMHDAVRSKSDYDPYLYVEVEAEAL